MNVQSSFYRSVNSTEQAPRSNLARLQAISSFWTPFVGIYAGISVSLRSNLARLQAISSFWTPFVGIYATKRKSCTGVPWGPFNHCCTCTVTPTFATSFDNFIPTYQSLHVCCVVARLCFARGLVHVVYP